LKAGFATINAMPKQKFRAYDDITRAMRKAESREDGRVKELLVDPIGVGIADNDAGDELSALLDLIPR
jgi:hypothetical protein